MNQHEHAEVLRAIADGASVEYKYSSMGWLDANTQEYNPLTHPYFLWRIKLEPEITYKYFQKETCYPIFNSIDEKIVYSEFYPDLEHWDLRITYTNGIETNVELSQRSLNVN